MQQLRSRWEEVKRKIEELHPRVQVMAENFSEYKEKLQSLVHWVEEAEQTCDALERVQDYNEFQPLMQTFQVLQALQPLSKKQIISISSSYEQFCTRTLFETEAQDNSEMAYSDTSSQGTHLFPQELIRYFSTSSAGIYAVLSETMRKNNKGKS